MINSILFTIFNLLGVWILQKIKLVNMTTLFPLTFTHSCAQSFTLWHLHIHSHWHMGLLLRGRCGLPSVKSETDPKMNSTLNTIHGKSHNWCITKVSWLPQSLTGAMIPKPLFSAVNVDFLFYTDAEMAQRKLIQNNGYDEWISHVSNGSSRVLCTLAHTFFSFKTMWVKCPLYSLL